MDTPKSNTEINRPAGVSLGLCDGWINMVIKWEVATMSPCRLWQADPRSAGNRVKDTSSSCTYNMSLTFWPLHSSQGGFSLYTCRTRAIETACLGLAILSFKLNCDEKEKKIKESLHISRKEHIVLGPRQQNVKRLRTAFCVYIGRANKSILGWQENANADKINAPRCQIHRHKRADLAHCAHRQYIYTRACTRTWRQICDTRRPYDPHAPYGQDEGRKISTQLCGWLQLGSQQSPEVCGVEATQPWLVQPSFPYQCSRPALYTVGYSINIAVAVGA